MKKLLTIALVTVILTSCQQATEKTSTMEDNKKEKTTAPADGYNGLNYATHFG
ncbi:hypothetical protein LVD15_22615 [Fulvivirga maritima]|uniref:hypothetical protein n=1 Tax=Fulvivirga maritima TaxID=2904247 RepID=UPI001F4710F6|nr:hypothetical protein [Fulvivirga maritima]UII26068.1 hypothetical protein LVD15_22615 [Fulvivirga maritima]